MAQRTSLSPTKSLLPSQANRSRPPHPSPNKMSASRGSLQQIYLCITDQSLLTLEVIVIGRGKGNSEVEEWLHNTTWVVATNNIKQVPSLYSSEQNFIDQFPIPSSCIYCYMELLDHG